MGQFCRVILGDDEIMVAEMLNNAVKAKTGGGISQLMTYKPGVSVGS